MYIPSSVVFSGSKTLCSVHIPPEGHGVFTILLPPIKCVQLCAAVCRRTAGRVSVLRLTHDLACCHGDEWLASKQLWPLRLSPSVSLRERHKSVTVVGAKESVC